MNIGWGRRLVLLSGMAVLVCLMGCHPVLTIHEVSPAQDGMELPEAVVAFHVNRHLYELYLPEMRLVPLDTLRIGGGVEYGPAGMEAGELERMAVWYRDLHPPTIRPSSSLEASIVVGLPVNAALDEAGNLYATSDIVSGDTSRSASGVVIRVDRSSIRRDTLSDLAAEGLLVSEIEVSRDGLYLAYGVFDPSSTPYQNWVAIYDVESRREIERIRFDSVSITEWLTDSRRLVLDSTEGRFFYDVNHGLTPASAEWNMVDSQLDEMWYFYVEGRGEYAPRYTLRIARFGGATDIPLLTERKQIGIAFDARSEM